MRRGKDFKFTEWETDFLLLLYQKWNVILFSLTKKKSWICKTTFSIENISTTRSEKITQLMTESWSPLSLIWSATISTHTFIPWVRFYRVFQLSDGFDQYNFKISIALEQSKRNHSFRHCFSWTAEIQLWPKSSKLGGWLA